MTIHYTEIIGLHFVLMLAAWWSVALILTVLVTAIRRAWVRRVRARAGHSGRAATGGRLGV
jgi:hypothetical protein